VRDFVNNIISRVLKLFSVHKSSYKGLVECSSIVESHGYIVHFYSPSIHICHHDEEFNDACERLASTGHVITTKDGVLVGNFYPRARFKGNNRPFLRVVK